jgi:hypothetical protein
MCWASRRSISVLLSLLFLLTLLTGCKTWTERGAKGIGLLPKAAPGEQHFSSYQPTNPYIQLGEGILYRKMFEAPGPTGVRIEVRDLLVGPRKHTAKVNLPGAAICEVRSGSGVLTSGDQPQQLRPGATFSLPDDAMFSIESNSNDPISIRAQLIRAE